MKRNTSRIKAMMMLYNNDILKGEKDDDLSIIIDEEIGESDLEFALTLYNGVLDNLSLIDNLISSNLENYKLNRLNYVDRALVRIGVYEMLFIKTPSSIVINEIVEISKKYSQIDDYVSSKFNNALLDKIASRIKNE